MTNLQQDTGEIAKYATYCQRVYGGRFQMYWSGKNMYLCKYAHKKESFDETYVKNQVGDNTERKSTLNGNTKVTIALSCYQVHSQAIIQGGITPIKSLR